MLKNSFLIWSIIIFTCPKSNLSGPAQFLVGKGEWATISFKHWFWVCPHHNPSLIQARITKFGPEVQNTLVKIPIVLGGNWPWPSRSSWTPNSKFTPFSEPIQRTAIGTAPWHRLFHSVNVSWWDHIECATGRRPFGLGLWWDWGSSIFTILGCILI